MENTCGFHDAYDYEYSEEESSSESVQSEDEDDEPQSTPASSISTLPRRRSARAPSSRARTLRHRPFIMFNKTPPRGFKKLTPKSKSKKTPLPPKDQPGDGFSDHEARPSGFIQVLGKRKLPPRATSGAGALGLTQSKSPAKQRKKVRRVEDNSFITAPQKPTRPLEGKRLTKNDKAVTNAKDYRPVPEADPNETVRALAPYGARASIILEDSPEKNEKNSDAQNREELESRAMDRGVDSNTRADVFPVAVFSEHANYFLYSANWSSSPDGQPNENLGDIH